MNNQDDFLLEFKDLEEKSIKNSLAPNKFGVFF